MLAHLMLSPDDPLPTRVLLTTKNSSPQHLLWVDVDPASVDSGGFTVSRTHTRTDPVGGGSAWQSHDRVRIPASNVIATMRTTFVTDSSTGTAHGDGVVVQLRQMPLCWDGPNMHGAHPPGVTP